jgi:hypothetical protein
VACISGSCAGIIGLSSYMGFLFYLVVSILISISFVLKMKNKPKEYIVSQSMIWKEGVIQGLMVLFLLILHFKFQFIKCKSNINTIFHLTDILTVHKSYILFWTYVLHFIYLIFINQKTDCFDFKQRLLFNVVHLY